MSKIILHLCADIGSDSTPYNEAGYTVIKIGKDIGIENYTPPANVYGIIANPPCTEFSVANQNRIHDYNKGMFLVNHCLRIIKECNPKFWVLENPASGHLRRFLGKPLHTYQPYQYGSPWTKNTALWGNFNIPLPTNTWDNCVKIPELYIAPRDTKPSLVKLHKTAIKFMPEFTRFKDMIKSNMDFRSLCSQKFAQAFFEVNQ